MIHSSHLLHTQETCIQFHGMDNTCPVCSGGLAVCQRCHTYESGLDKPCAVHVAQVKTCPRCELEKPITNSGLCSACEEYSERQYLHFLLTYLGSEACEVAHAVSKVVLFGTQDTWDGKLAFTAWETLEAEVDDLRAVLEVFKELGKPLVPSAERIAAKREKMREMFFYASGRSLIDLPITHVKE